MDDARLLATDAILDRGVRFNIPHAPVRYRLLGLNRITIKPLRAGTILEISRVVTAQHLDDAMMLKDHAFLSESIHHIAECVALAMCNSRLRIRLLRRVYTRLILELPTEVILRIYEHIEQRNSKRLFLTITRYFSATTQMMTDPKDLGQATKGS